MLQGMGMTVCLMPHDVPTWWNSSADMVEFALEYHEPINIMTQKRDLGLRNLELSDEEWSTEGASCSSEGADTPKP